MGAGPTAYISAQLGFPRIKVQSMKLELKDGQFVEVEISTCGKALYMDATYGRGVEPRWVIRIATDGAVTTHKPETCFSTSSDGMDREILELRRARLLAEGQARVVEASEEELRRLAGGGFHFG